MKRTNTKHMRFKGYADGGKVVKSEYGKPTFAKSVAAMASDYVSDGYDWLPKLKNKMKAPKRDYLDPARQKALDET